MFRANLTLSLTATLLLAAAISFAGRGGPDGGGWAWADSAEPFVDASTETSTGMTLIVPRFPDEGVFPVTLSFPFTLYGVTSDTVWVSSNGWLSLVDPGTTTAPFNRPMPEAGHPAAVLAYAWEDMVDGFLQAGPTPNGHLLLARHFLKSGEIVQVWIQFYRTGAVKVVYVTNPPLASMTVGIENDGTGGDIGTQLALNGATHPEANFAAGYAVQFYPLQSPDCAAATPIACSARVAGSTLGGSDLARYGCSGRTYTGSEAVYQLDLTGLQTLDVAVSGFAGRDLDVFVLNDRCDATLGCFGGGADTVNVPVAGTGTYYLAVDGVTGTDDGPFDLDVACSPISAPIACGTTVAGNASGASGFDVYGCQAGDFTGSESIYTFSLAAPTTIQANLASAAPFDLFLADQSRIAPGTTPCLRHGDTAVGEVNLPAGDYALMVDGPAGTNGAFNLQLDCFPAVPAVPIRCGDVSVPGSNVGASLIDWYSSCGFGAYFRGEEYYRFTPTGRVFATATHGSGTGFDLFAFREADLPDTCAVGADTTITMANIALEDHIFVMDSNSTTGPTSLSLSCRTMVTTDVTCDTTVAGVTSGLSEIDGYSCRNPKRMDGGESFFVFDNPVRQSFAVGVDSVNDLDVVIMQGPFDPLRPFCSAGGDRITRWDNADPGEYLIIVDGDATTSGSAFDLSVTCGSSALDCTAAPPLTCNSLITGDTALGTPSAAIYGIAEDLFSGPELIYSFTQPGPGDRPVSFVVRNPSDARIDVILIDACDPSRVIDWSDDAVIAPSLPPGDYFVVVDGRAGVSGTFELVTFCDGPSIDPPVVTTTMGGGECVVVDTKLFFPPSVPIADVMFSFDLSGSMDRELAQVKRNATEMYTALNTLIPSLQFGLASFVEHNFSYPSADCAFSHFPSAPFGYPFALEIPLTTDMTAVDLELQTINIIGGANETYTRSFHEAWANPDIGWRTCARKLWLSFGDEPPMDCNIYECLGLTRMNNGKDPGPNLIPGDADDLELLPTVDNMAAAGIILLPIDSSENPQEIEMWDCLAQRTGGEVFTTDRNGVIPDGTNIVDGLVGLIIDAIRPCPDVRLVPTGPYAAWVTITPSSYTDILTPWYGEFTVEFCIPPGTPPGPYAIAVEARCVGIGGCANELLVTQSVDIEVTEPCPIDPTAAVATPAPVCEGATVTLDGSASTACGPAGLEYRWLDSSATEVPGCGWSTTPTCDVTTPVTADYTLEVRCADSPDCVATTATTIEVIPFPAPALEPLPTICLGEAVVLDASATDPLGCPVPLQYRFLSGGTPLAPWATTATMPVSPAASTTYTVEVRCPAAAPACLARTEQSVIVVPPPVADAGSGDNVCEGIGVLLDASGSADPGCPAGLEYRWFVGAVPMTPWSPTPTFSPPTATAGTTVYTVEARCAGLTGCTDADTATVVVRLCGLAVHYDYFAAAWTTTSPAVVEITWGTLLEDGTNAFVVQRSDQSDGPYWEVAVIGAEGPGYAYRVADDMPIRATRPWYTILELTDDGEGDRTPPFQVAEPPSTGGKSAAGRSRGRLTRPSSR